MKLISLLTVLILGWGLFPSTVVAESLAVILATGHLRIGVKDNLPPLGFRDSQGQLQGLEIDLARKLTQELLGLDAQVELIPLLNQERLPALLEGKVDLVIAQMGATPNRARLVTFSPYYYLDGTGLLMKTSTHVSAIAPSKIAVLQGSSAIAVLQAWRPQAELIGVASYQAALTLLEKNQVDAIAADNTVLAGLHQTLPGYQYLPLRLSGEPLAIAMPKGLQYQDLHQRIYQILERLQESGWLAERIQYWGLPHF
ncbi:transporter substrate-binding domain-containing protein [Synechocystis sp. LKSZ1]|uniref:transporter substrate-binding domain-containing protein n=1 Tax=Synechocystis sp. LKSZ1 TaxID=3144951 RepID=UPI00336BF1AC